MYSYSAFSNVLVLIHHQCTRTHTHTHPSSMYSYSYSYSSIINVLVLILIHHQCTRTCTHPSSMYSYLYSSIINVLVLLKMYSAPGLLLSNQQTCVCICRLYDFFTLDPGQIFLNCLFSAYCLKWELTNFQNFCRNPV